MQRCDDLLNVAELVDESITLWHECTTSFPVSGRQYSEEEQKEREPILDQFLHTIETESLRLLQRRTDRERSLERITSAFAQFASAALDLDDASLELLLRDGFSAVGTELARQARHFDATVSVSDILQASRNAWTACGLQLLLGQPMRLTPAIFAYSMLYPYSDNYLDSAEIPREEKLAFSSRFRKRLAGQHFEWTSEREAAIWRLVALIEAQYRRTDYPHVYASLLAIHQAQEESLCQLRLNGVLSSEDVLRLSCTKGGTSVLADAYLGAGALRPHQAKFSFLWGILLQLGDDLQDLHDDLARGSLTLFSQAAGHQPLDKLTNRLMNFASKLRPHMDSLENGSETLKTLLKRSSQSIIIRSAGYAAEYYTTAYIRELERFSPFRFDFLLTRQERVASRTELYTQMFEALLAAREEEPVFPSLPAAFVLPVWGTRFSSETALRKWDPSGVL